MKGCIIKSDAVIFSPLQMKSVIQVVSEGTNGFEAVNHYHIYNPNYTKKKIDLYFDIYGNTVGKG